MGRHPKNGVPSGAQRVRPRAAKQHRNSLDLRAASLTPCPFCANYLKAVPDCPIRHLSTFAVTPVAQPGEWLPPSWPNPKRVCPARAGTFPTNERGMSNSQNCFFECTEKMGRHPKMASHQERRRITSPAPIHIRRNAGSSTKGVAAAKLAKPQTRVSSTRGNFSD
jgi:hypothetical protein